MFDPQIMIIWIIIDSIVNLSVINIFIKKRAGIFKNFYQILFINHVGVLKV